MSLGEEMATGTSVPGFQQVIIGASRLSNYVYVLIGAASPKNPERLGVYYLFLRSTDATPSEVLIQRGLVYGPGIYDLIPSRQTDTIDSIRCVVNWNRGGILWDFDIGVA